MRLWCLLPVMLAGVASSHAANAGDRARGCRFHDQPGKVSFVDTTVAKEGQASLRFENFGQYAHGHGRVMFEVPVRPHRFYRVTGWVKTEIEHG